MPLFSDLLRPKDGGGRSRSKLPKPPISPKSPKPPTNFSKTQRNGNNLNQCGGCNNVETLISTNIDHQKAGMKRAPKGILHNNFGELDDCAHTCHTCRVFRQALILAEVTFDGVKELRQTPGEILVNWRENTVDGAVGFFLEVELKAAPSRVGVVNCHGRNIIEHLALPADGLSSATMDQAKDWLRICRQTHTGSCDNLRWNNQNPRLLIEILSPTSIRLCENQKGEYVALSYCWGTSLLSKMEEQEVERGKTMHKDMGRRSQPFPISDLPATVRDALHFIHAMNIRYAWIDALCIVQDKPEGIETMHLVYSNALFTLCVCTTTRATASLLDKREAWAHSTEPCRLGGQWLTTTDMSLNELRLQSPLASRAWTLQEERLSPRMMYLSSSRIYWSCAAGQQMELKPTYDQRPTPLPRPIYAASDRNNEMPPAQDFLLACWSGTNDLHSYWADIVKSYASRRMSVPADRLKALSGVAARYLNASKGDEYLAGLWAKHIAEGLAWRVHHAVEINHNDHKSMEMSSSLPSWSWAVLPLPVAIETDTTSARSPFFKSVIGSRGEQLTISRRTVDDNIRRGEEVKEIRVTSRTRTMWGPTSRRIDWSTVSTFKGHEESFTFSFDQEQDMHAVHPKSGRVLVYEDRKRVVLGQIDLQQDVERMQSAQMNLKALELGLSTMLLLQYSGEGAWRRVGVAWDVREDYFASAQTEVLILR